VRLARKTGQIVGRGGTAGWSASSSAATAKPAAGATSATPCTVRPDLPYKVLRERDLGGRVEGIAITLNEYLNRRLETAAKPKLREKSYQSYESLLRRYIRPLQGERMLSAICPLDVQGVYQKMIDHGLSSHTIC
jgi:hypothetical protein